MSKYLRIALSILFMRFCVFYYYFGGGQEIFQFSLWDSQPVFQFYPCTFIISFNSLYEILHLKPRVYWFFGGLSILFMRFIEWSRDGTNYYNLLSILFMRFLKLCTNCRPRLFFFFQFSLWDSKISGWSQIVCLNLLSILFMRFSGFKFTTPNKLDFFQFSLWDSFKTNSVKAEDFNFQFSLWDSEYVNFCDETQPGDFQFSLWDSLFEYIIEELQFFFQFSLWDSFWYKYF